MDDKTLVLLKDKIALEQLMQEGYFKASGDLSLLPCPFCGSRDVYYEKYIREVGPRWRVVCLGCIASIDPGWAQSRSVVQGMWNTRAQILSAEKLEG